MRGIILLKWGVAVLENYWRLFFDIKVAVYYYQLYAVKAQNWRRAVSVLCTVSSLACVVSWYQSGLCPLLWGSLIFASQLVSVLQPLFPYDAQLHSATCIYAGLKRLARDAENTWFSFDEETCPDKILEAIKRLSSDFGEIEAQFSSADTFPPNSRLHQKAEAFAMTYFRRFEL